MPALRLGPLVPLAFTAAALVLAAMALWYRPARPQPLVLNLPQATTTPPADGQYKVYIAGAVARPGVYPFRPGERVADAIEAAGGPTADADLLRVNLARRLHDEDQVVVPRQAAPAGPGGEAAAGGISGRKVDLNSAPAAVLESLPGIGPSRAQRIVESRNRDGRFSEPADLVKRKLVPQSVFDGIKDLIDVQP